MPSTLLSLFSQVAAPRRGQGQMYPLAPIPLFTELAMLAVARSYRQVELVFRDRAAGLAEGAGLVAAVAIDGKTLRGSFDVFHDRKAAHVLIAFAAEGQIILAHLAVAQEMIATLDLTGACSLRTPCTVKQHLKLPATRGTTF